MAEPAPPLAGPLPARLADDIALLLQAEGIDAARVDSSAGVFIVVTAADRGRAARIVAEEYPRGLDTAAASIAGAGASATGARRHGVDLAAQDRWFGRGSWVVMLLAFAAAAVFVGEELSGGSET